MNIHTCKICTSIHREAIESWRFKEAMAYRPLVERIKKELNMDVSLGTITKHFQFATDDIAQAVNSQIKDFIKLKAVDSMDVAVQNVTLADSVIEQLVEGGKLRRPDMVSELVMLMRERRQSAELMLKYSGASEGDALSSIADEMKAARERVSRGKAKA